MLLDMLFLFLDMLYWNKKPFGLIRAQLWQSVQCSLIADLHHPCVLAPVIFSSHWRGRGLCDNDNRLLIKVSSLPSPPLSYTVQIER